MLPRLDAAVVTPLTPAAGAGASVAIGDGRQAAFQRALQGMVGQTVTAEVISSVKDGSFIVKVADSAVRMLLPPGTQVGAQVPLTVMSANPRPTFQLGNGTPGGAASLVYADAGGEAAAPLPSQGSAVYVPASGRPPAGAVPAQPGQSGQPGAAAGAPAGAEPALEGDSALPGQVKPGTTATNNPTNPASGRPGLPTGADAADSAPAGLPARPGISAGPATSAATGAPAMPANPAALPASAAAAQPAVALASGSAGAAGSAVPAEAVRPQSLAATLLGKAPLTPADQLPDLDPNTPLPTLSSTARVLTTVLGTSQAGQAAQLALIGKTALFGNAAPDTGQLTQKLHDAISQSGLFYESHVTEWVKGERSLTELMREPQMQRMAQGGEAAARAAANGPDLSAAQLINQQLHTQEQARVQWNGQAWPGQAMQWEIRREQREGRKDSGGGEAEPEQVWRSGVRFRFPMLGSVSASVTLVGDQVHIQVQADSDDSATTLRAYASQLETAMEAAGAPLSSLTIGQEIRDDG